MIAIALSVHCSVESILRRAERCGAALSRRNFGETVAHLTAPSRYPYQFCANYGKFAENVDRMPVDAKMLVALLAPRPILLQTGDKDFWSDPKGEFLAAVAAGPVFRLLGNKDWISIRCLRLGPESSTLSATSNTSGSRHDSFGLGSISEVSPDAPSALTRDCLS